MRHGKCKVSGHSNKFIDLKSGTQVNFTLNHDDSFKVHRGELEFNASLNQLGCSQDSVGHPMYTVY